MRGKQAWGYVDVERGYTYRFWVCLCECTWYAAGSTPEVRHGEEVKRQLETPIKISTRRCVSMPTCVGDAYIVLVATCVWPSRK